MISRVRLPVLTQGVVRFTALIFLSALAIRIGLLFLFPSFDFIRPMEMERVARSFAETGVLANPYATPTGPTAHVLPLYPMLLGAIYRIWGSGQTGRMVQGLFSCTLASLRCALLFPFALFMGLDRRTAQLASLVPSSFPQTMSIDAPSRGWVTRGIVSAFTSRYRGSIIFWEDREVGPELEAGHDSTGVPLGHLLVNYPVSGCHPLDISLADRTGVSYAVSVLHLSPII